MDNNLNAALKYGKLGYSVIPLYTVKDGKCSCGNSEKCEHPGKHPRIKDWVKEASKDPSVITKWFTCWPDSNIGIVTGISSGFIVIDIDPRHGGTENFNDLEYEHGKLPSTVEQLTGGGGRHLLFKHPGIKVENRINIVPGVDIKSDGGFIVASPSMHVSGRKYEWELSSMPGEVEIAELPTKWLNFITCMKKLTVQPSPSLIESIPEGNRNNTIFKLASSLYAKGYAENEIMAAMSEFNVNRCSPPLSDAEVKRIIVSVSRYQPGRLHIDDPWEAPMPFDTYNLPKFPTHCLPSPIKEFVKAVAEETQTSEGMAAVIALGVSSIPCNKIYKVEGKQGWLEPMSLYCTVVAKPGERKSAVMTYATKPLYEFESEENERLKPFIAKNQAERKILDGEVEKLKVVASKTGSEEDRMKALNKSAELSQYKEIKPFRLICDDISPEKLVGLLEENKGRMAIVSSEGGIFDIMAGRYSDSANLDVFLKGHAGDYLRVDRVGRNGEVINEPAMSIVIAIQPEVLTGVMKNSSFKGRGLTARFVYSLPLSLIGQRNIESKPVPAYVKNDYSATLRQMLKIEVPEKPYILKLSYGAKMLSINFANSLEPRLIGDLENIVEWGSKLHGAILRIAGILHAVKHANERPWEYEISEETFNNALEIGEYFIEHAKAAFAIMGTDKVIDNCKYVLRWIEKQGEVELNKRDIFRGNRGRFKEVSEIDPVLKLLCEYGYLKECQQQRPGAVKRIDTYYLVNPSFLTSFPYGQTGHTGQTENN